MAEFAYQARTLTGKVVQGKIEARDRRSAGQNLLRQGLNPLKIAAVGGRSRSRRSGGANALAQWRTKLAALNELELFKKPIKVKDIAVFLRQFAAMVEAGLPFGKIFQILELQTTNPQMKKTVHTVRGELENGESLSNAMEKHPEVFSAIVTNMIRAGEMGGILEQILNRLAGFVEFEYAIRGKLKSALTYPIVLLCITALVLAFMLLFILPQFVGMFTTAGVELPLPTIILLTMMHALKTYGWYFLGAVIAGVVALKRWFRTPGGRYQLDRFLLKVPIIKGIITKVVVSRLTKTLASLHNVGVPILQTLGIIGKTLNNSYYERQLQAVAQRIKAGEGIGSAFTAEMDFPEMVNQMITVGDETGELALMSEKISAYYDQELEEDVKRLTTILEPIMIVFMAVVVGFMAVSVLLPIFDMIRVVRG